MTNPSILDQIIESNRNFLAGVCRPLDETGDPFIVVACLDPRLTGLLEPALGLPRHRAIVIRVAGNRISGRGHDVLRSVAAGVYVKNAGTILVVGHTDCAMASFSASRAIESFRKAGVPRAAFGEGDLREWFGAFADIRQNVIQGMDCLRSSGLLPLDIRLHGLIIDTVDGRLEVLSEGDAATREGRPEAKDTPVPRAAPGSAAEAERTPRAEKVPPVPPVPEARKGPVIIAGPEPGPAARETLPSALLDAGLMVRDFISHQQRDPHLQRRLAGLKQLVKTEKNPARILAEVQDLLGEYEAQYPDLSGILDQLRSRVEPRGATGTVLRDFVRRITE